MKVGILGLAGWRLTRWRPAGWKPAGWLYLAAVLVMYCLVFWNARDLIVKGYPDFTIYYTAGTMVRQGMGHNLYDDAKQFEVQQRFAPQVATRLAALPFNHPPFEALLFVPFSLFSYRTAYLLWMLANLVMLAVLPILIRPCMTAMAAWPSPVWSILSLAFFPVFFALFQGQDAILLMFLYGLAFVALRKERLVSAGAWLACGLFKFHLILPFLFLLLIQQKTLRRKSKILCGFGLVGAFLGVVSLATVGMRQMLAYPSYVLGLEATMARGAIMPSDMPNLRGALYLIAAHLRHFDLLAVSLSAVLFLVAALISRAKDDGTEHSEAGHDSEPDGADDLKFALAVFATVLVSYHGLGYDLSILALPILLLYGELKESASSVSWPRAWPRRAIVVGLAILLFSPLQLVLLMRYNRLALMGWVVLLVFVGIAGELRSRTRGIFHS